MRKRNMWKPRPESPRDKKALEEAMVPGVQVRFSGVHLRSIGQMVGGEGHKTWTVLKCPCYFCREGKWVAVGEESYAFNPDEDPPHMQWRHISRGALVIVGRLSLRNCP